MSTQQTVAPTFAPNFSIPPPPVDKKPIFENSDEKKEYQTPLSKNQILFNAPFIMFVLDNCCRKSFTITGNTYSFQMCDSCGRRNRQARFINA